MSHYLVKPLYYYSVQAPTMKSNRAPSPSPSTMLLTTLITGPQFNIVWGGGAKFRKSFKSLQINFQDCSNQRSRVRFSPWSGTDFSAYKFCSRLDYFCQKNLKIPLLPIFLNTSGPTASSCRNAVHYQCDLFHELMSS